MVGLMRISVSRDRVHRQLAEDMASHECPLCADHAQNALLDGTFSPESSVHGSRLDNQLPQASDTKSNGKRRNLLPSPWSILWPSRNQKVFEVTTESIGQQIEAYKALWQEREGGLPGNLTEKTLETHFSSLPTSYAAVSWSISSIMNHRDLLQKAQRLDPGIPVLAIEFPTASVEPPPESPLQRSLPLDAPPFGATFASTPSTPAQTYSMPDIPEPPVSGSFAVFDIELDGRSNQSSASAIPRSPGRSHSARLNLVRNSSISSGSLSGSSHAWRNRDAAGRLQDLCAEVEGEMEDWSQSSGTTSASAATASCNSSASNIADDARDSSVRAEVTFAVKGHVCRHLLAASLCRQGMRPLSLVTYLVLPQIVEGSSRGGSAGRSGSRRPGSDCSATLGVLAVAAPGSEATERHVCDAMTTACEEAIAARANWRGGVSAGKPWAQGADRGRKKRTGWGAKSEAQNIAAGHVDAHVAGLAQLSMSPDVKTPMSPFLRGEARLDAGRSSDAVGSAPVFPRAVSSRDREGNAPAAGVSDSPAVRDLQGEVLRLSPLPPQNPAAEPTNTPGDSVRHKRGGSLEAGGWEVDADKGSEASQHNGTSFANQEKKPLQQQQTSGLHTDSREFELVLASQTASMLSKTLSRPSGTTACQAASQQSQLLAVDKTSPPPTLSGERNMASRAVDVQRATLPCAPPAALAGAAAAGASAEDLPPLRLAPGAPRAEQPKMEGSALAALFPKRSAQSRTPGHSPARSPARSPTRSPARSPARGHFFGHPPLPASLLGGAQRASLSTSPVYASNPMVLQLLLSEQGAMKQELKRFLLDPLKLEIGAVLASGASGEVRRGKYDGMDVAVKVLRGSSSTGAGAGGKEESRGGGRAGGCPRILAEFRREVLTLMSAGRCKQLLQFHGVCVDVRQRLCIVTRLMKGGALHDLLRKRNGVGLPPPQLRRIALDVARGMAYLHAHGIIHRDLKAANVLLDEEGNAVVGDFGVARLKGERGEMTKEVGTYRWMAPEAFGTASWAVTHRSDVYSFGIVLWELLTARVPYEDYSPLQAAVAVALNGLRPAIPEACPPDLAALIQRCWHKDPGERPEFGEIIGALEEMGRREGERERERERERARPAEVEERQQRQPGKESSEAQGGGAEAMEGVEAGCGDSSAGRASVSSGGENMDVDG